MNDVNFGVEYECIFPKMITEALNILLRVNQSRTLEGEINGINPQSKLWKLISAASYGEFNNPFSSAEAERAGVLNPTA